MRHFIDIVAGADQATPECEEMFLRVLLPGLKIVLHSDNEIVWMEVVGFFWNFFDYLSVDPEFDSEKSLQSSKFRQIWDSLFFCQESSSDIFDSYKFSIFSKDDQV